MSTTLIESFPEYADRSCGIPFLRGWKNRKNMTVQWGDGSLSYYIEFAQALDHEAMNAALKEIWERYKPQCGRRASLSRGSVHGCMFAVPIAAGEEAMMVVREYFTRALAILPDYDRPLEERLAPHPGSFRCPIA